MPDFPNRRMRFVRLQDDFLLLLQLRKEVARDRRCDLLLESHLLN